VALLAVASCSLPVAHPAGYDDLLGGPIPDTALLHSKLAAPSGRCRAMAREHVAEEALSAASLDAETRARLHALLDGLHPVAKRVLARTSGVWFVPQIPGAAGLFVPCDVDVAAGTGGFLLVDLGDHPLDEHLREQDVPSLYWSTMAGAPGPIASIDGALPAGAPAVVPQRTSRGHGAIRYVLLHEIGHALSVHAREFDVSRDGRFDLGRVGPFASHSWRAMTTDRRFLDPQDAGDEAVSIVPIALDLHSWGTLLDVIEGAAPRLVPGFALRPAEDLDERSRIICRLVDDLPRAGFVTPTATRFPTEDYAVMFTHAILADEGTIHPGSRLQVLLPDCQRSSIANPYFAPGVAHKRNYMTRMLGVSGRAMVPPLSAEPRAAPR
jgi:hypothetical protein